MSRKKDIKEENNTDSAKIHSFSEEEVKLTGLFEEFLQYKKQDLFKEFLQYRNQTAGENVIPLSIFNNGALGPLETIVKYLREESGYTYSKIGALLNRKTGPIGASYREAKKKLGSKLDISPTKFSIPIHIFKDSKMTILETIVAYLKDDAGLGFRSIAELLNRNYRTVWTVYNRAKKR